MTFFVSIQYTTAYFVEFFALSGWGLMFREASRLKSWLARSCTDLVIRYRSWKIQFQTQFDDLRMFQLVVTSNLSAQTETWNCLALGHKVFHSLVLWANGTQDFAVSATSRFRMIYSGHLLLQFQPDELHSVFLQHMFIMIWSKLLPLDSRRKRSTFTSTFFVKFTCAFREQNSRVGGERSTSIKPNWHFESCFESYNLLDTSFFHRIQLLPLYWINTSIRLTGSPEYVI